MPDDTVLDTTIHEPSMTAGEVEMLRFALDRAGRSSPGSAAAWTRPACAGRTHRRR